MSRQSRRKLQMMLDILRRFNPVRAYLFGSWARGEEDEFSDLDLVVIMQTPLPFFERALSIARHFPLELGAVDLLVYTPEEWEQMRMSGNVLAETVLEEGTIIYEAA